MSSSATSREVLPNWTRLLLDGRMIGAAFVALVVTLPMMLGTNRALLAFMILIAIYATAGQSLVLLYGSAGIMSVGQGALVGLGAYATAIVSLRTGLSFASVVILVIVVSVIVSGLLALTSVRTSGHYFVIVTFAFGEIAVAVADNLTEWTGGNGGLPFVKPLELFGISFGPLDLVQGYYLSAFVLLISMAAVLLVLRGKFGDRLASIRENQDLAEALGVNVRATKIMAFMWAAVFTGVAGVVWAYQTHFMSPDQFSPAKLGITLVLATLIGGARSPLGPVIGASVALLGPQMLGLSPYVNEMLLGLIFIVVILLMPNGVTGACRQWLTRAGERTVRLSTDRAAEDERVDSIEPEEVRSR